MKKNVKLIGIICLMAVIGFTIAGCDDPVAPPPIDIWEYYGLSEEDIVGITVYKQPTKLVYDYLEPFDPEGMIVMAMLNDGTMAPVTDFEFSDLYGDENRPYTVTISYGEFITTFNVFVFTSKERAPKPKAFIRGTGDRADDVEIVCMSITGAPLSVPSGTQYYVITDHVGTGDVEIWYCQQNNLGASRGGQRAVIYGTNPPHPRETAPLRNASTNAASDTTVRFVVTDWGGGNGPHYIDSEALVIQFSIQN